MRGEKQQHVLFTHRPQRATVITPTSPTRGAGRARTARAKIEMREETRARRITKACMGDERCLKALDR